MNAQTQIKPEIQPCANDVRSDGQRIPGQMRQQCKICNSRARIRSHEPITDMVTDYYIQCVNEDCGAVWKAQMEILYLTSPSGIENPAVDIPMAPEGTPRKIFPTAAEEKAADDRQIPMFEET